MNRTLKLFSILLSFVMLAAACTPDTGSEVKNETGLVVSGVSVPTSVSTQTGAEVVFKVYAKAPQAGDIVVLENKGGDRFELPLSKCEEKQFGFIIPEGFYTGTYTMYVQRGEESVKIGTLDFKVEVVLNIVPDEGITVYGMIQCNGKPVADVVVSDGYNFAKSDTRGVYQLASAKKHGYVFMSVPSGYTVRTEGAQPMFHEYLVKPADEVERADFVLFEDPGQDKHTMIVMGDIHLAKRNNDVGQFTTFVNDLNTFMASQPSTKFYGLTLGDMSWDQYWVTNGYDLNNYLDDIAALKNIPVFNTIGNHDHEQMASGDFNTVAVYKKLVGPTYYSFNIGKIHYIALDDIECTNNGTGSRTYNTKIVQEQIDWVKKDLEFISAETPVVISMHSPVYNNKGTNRLSNSDQLIAALGNREVHYMTGHTHVMYNIEKNAQYEHNAGAVCATWWWSAQETPGIHIATDGAPGGYLVFEVDGTDFKWVFKGTGKPLTHQFRTYDRNEIEMTAGKYVPSADASHQEDFVKAASAYIAKSTANEVLINVWNWDPTWKVEVTENGKALTATRVEMRDPLHLISYSAKRLNKSKDATFLTDNNYHMFKVTASSATSTLDIKVTDRFGNVYTESMKRPKAFEPETYK